MARQTNGGLEVSSGRLGCHRAISEYKLLVWDENKVDLGQKLMLKHHITLIGVYMHSRGMVTRCFLVT